MNTLLGVTGCLIVYLTSLTEGKTHGNCIHGGVEYTDGEYFSPNYTELLSAELPGQCMQCNCNFGVVYCELKTCAYVSCDGDLGRLRPCCRQCPRKSIEPDKSSEIIFPAPRQNKTRKKLDCISDGKLHKDGSTWQPNIGPLGTMSCVQCACVNAEVTCKRYPCRELPCSHPRKQFGHCCPVCPILETSQGGGILCLPRSSEVFVFKRPKMGKTADVIEYGFIQGSSRNKLDLHIWDTNVATESRFNITQIPRTLLIERNLTIAGSTSFKHWTRFLKREKRLKNRCKTNCAERVVRLEDTLKLYPVTSRTRCRSDEIDVAGL